MAKNVTVLLKEVLHFFDFEPMLPISNASPYRILLSFSYDRRLLAGPMGGRSKKSAGLV
jgi:hypothetical protein